MKIFLFQPDGTREGFRDCVTITTPTAGMLHFIGTDYLGKRVNIQTTETYRIFADNEPEEKKMTTISFSEAAALAYIAKKKKSLSRNQKENLTRGFTTPARKLVESLEKNRRTPRRLSKKRA